MPLPRALLSEANFNLAFARVLRGTNLDYKSYYRHLFPSYRAALDENLKDLIREVRSQSFRPTAPTIVYQPKPSGVLRPLTLLTLRDLIVYQAIVNVIADRFSPAQDAKARKISFGNLYAGSRSPFFFRSWKRSYKSYSQAVERAFALGSEWIADFDLVSCYELIDHNLLVTRLETRVRNRELLALLKDCLSVWTTNASGSHLRHGIPQGPEPSAYLAECLLHQFDCLKLKNVRYLRYVDDIRLMARTEGALRKALIRLDLESKDLGLVPQAQKISVRRARSLSDVLKSIPSGLAGAELEKGAARQSDLIKTLRRSMRKVQKRWEVQDVTKFKYALLRLNPRKDILQRIAPLLSTKPELSWVLSSYLRKFPHNRAASNVLLEAIRLDPAYDSAAANYIEAMDVCEPRTANVKYRRVIQTASRRSVEKSITLRIAILTFRGHRSGPAECVRLIESESHPIARGIAIHRLFGGSDPVHLPERCNELLERDCAHSDPDYSQYVTYQRLWDSLYFGPTWNPPGSASRSSKLLLKGIGLRRRAPARPDVLKKFFEDNAVRVTIPLRKALGTDFVDAQRRCLRLQKLLVGDPTARIMSLDTFNELLIGALSKADPTLAASYKKASGRKDQPDYGNWLTNADFTSALRVGSPWFLRVHSARVRADLAHAKVRAGLRKGRPTRPIGYEEAERLMREAVVPWRELFARFKKL